jgi:hypothetical protein
MASTKILNVMILVPNADGIAWLGQCHVKRALVFALDQYFHSIFQDCPKVRLLPKWWTVGFHDFYLHGGAVEESNGNLRSFHLHALDNAAFQNAGQLVIHIHIILQQDSPAGTLSGWPLGEIF